VAIDDVALYIAYEQRSPLLGARRQYHAPMDTTENECLQVLGIEVLGCGFCGTVHKSVCIRSDGFSVSCKRLQDPARKTVRLFNLMLLVTGHITITTAMLTI
jgi:hypothetical protein